MDVWWGIWYYIVFYVCFLCWDDYGFCFELSEWFEVSCVEV